MRRALVILAALAFLSSACGSRTGDGRQESGGPARFSFTTFEGEEFSADQHRGIPVVLNFWESW